MSSIFFVIKKETELNSAHNPNNILNLVSEDSVPGLWHNQGENFPAQRGQKLFSSIFRERKQTKQKHTTPNN